ncbi:hypothetical protein [Rhizobium sp. WYCCWR 11128]|uniref:hypothetical protein n=1 Tax=Rhizobium sp. WYCCWR 11128 TaxID=2749832 RepID=UPI0015D1DC7B|nr:hypothetical protein [Rhizobium sp. WYCCWR 11128]NYT33911.1 hypothetical protein [Rhizobium sp. WYCCWR 11128]
MPDKVFLETYPLYRPLSIKVPKTMDLLAKPSIKMKCEICRNDQTFLMISEYNYGRGYINVPCHNEIVQANYGCAGCNRQIRHFDIHISEDLSSVTKVGQFPPWDIQGNKQVERLLGDHRSYLRKGLICEGQGYGIGAFAYYRRIVEETIDGLLDEIPQLLGGAELEQFSDALAKTKTTRVTAEKIEIIKDLIPPVLRPDGMNPLRLLHETLSEGLHAQSDSDCMANAETIREILTFLANQIAAAAEAKKSFTSGMRALLEKKSKL